MMTERYLEARLEDVFWGKKKKERVRGDVKKQGGRRYGARDWEPV